MQHAKKKKKKKKVLEVSIQEYYSRDQARWVGAARRGGDDIPNNQGCNLAVLADVVLLAVGGGVGDTLVDGVLHVDQAGEVVLEGRTVGIYSHGQFSKEHVSL